MKAWEGSMVRCSTLKEAELIPDSAVPYTLPESRWNSSNRQTSNERVAEGLTHLTTCVALNNAGRNVAVLERAKRSWLVREESRQPTNLLVWVCVRSVSSLQIAARGDRAGWGSECSEHSRRCWTVTEQSHRAAESEVTRKLRRGMPLENSPSHTLHAFHYVWVWRCVCSWEYSLTWLSSFDLILNTLFIIHEC